VWAVSGRACDLVTRDGDVIALVTPSIGDGPLNVVLDRLNGLATLNRTNTELIAEGNCLRIEQFAVDMRSARTWEPCPDWEALRTRRSGIHRSLALLCAICSQHGRASHFAPLLEGIPNEDPFAKIVHRRAQRALADIHVGWHGDLDRLREAGARLAGLGQGLTPAGDDLLCGMMLWVWLASATPRPFSEVIAEAAAPRTTALSAAYLRAAARGECNAAWHALLSALSRGEEDPIAAAAHEVLRHGATSGADALLGFLSLALQPFRGLT